MLPAEETPGRGKTVTIIILIWLLALLCGLPAFFTSHIESNYFVDAPNGYTVFEDRVCLIHVQRLIESNSVDIS